MKARRVQIANHHHESTSMIIPINLSPSNSPDGVQFPPQLAKFGTDEVILLELQGAFQVEGDPAGQLAARFQMQNEVSENSSETCNAA
jgi:chromosome transmission fidelity protein 8